MTRDELRSLVRIAIGGRTDKNDEIDQALDMALRAIGTRHWWRDLVTQPADIEIDYERHSLSISDGTWSVDDRTLTSTGAFEDYTDHSTLDSVYVSGGTGVTKGWYRIKSRDSSDQITLYNEISDSDADDVEADKIGVPYSISLPSGTFRVIEARLIDGLNTRLIELRPKKWVTDRFPHPAVAVGGRPCYGYVESGRLFFVPYADASYFIRLTIYSLPTLGDDDTDEPTLDGIDDVIVSYAAMFMHQALESWESAKGWMERYEISLRQAIDRDKSRPGTIRRLSQRGEPIPYSGNYWDDPFVDRMP